MIGLNTAPLSLLALNQNPLRNGDFKCSDPPAGIMFLEVQLVSERKLNQPFRLYDLCVNETLKQDFCRSVVSGQHISSSFKMSSSG
ncbi:hypothetical protein AAC387_Pa06g0802 [Persea americana]